MDSGQLEMLVEQITREVVAAMAVDAGVCSVASGGSCSGCMLCVQLAPDSCQLIMDAGASRLSSTLGVRVSPSVAGVIDHTLLKPTATQEDLAKLCDEAREFQFISVCVNPFWVEFCSHRLAGTPVKVCAVIGFPLGATPPKVKVYEAEQCLLRGASELDMVLNIGALKSRQYDVVQKDIEMVAHACHRVNALCKVILETGLLNDEEKVRACELSKAAGADFVKTSTGFGPGGATVEDIALMRRVVGPAMGVKASGGVRSFDDVQKMLGAGASRIGASAGVQIIQGSTGAPGQY